MTMGEHDEDEGQITAGIVARAYGQDFDAIPADALDFIRQCWLDWFGVTLAGAREDAPSIMIEEAIDRGGGGSARLVGRGERLGLADAVLVNGVASHALDYDDGSPVMMAHPSVALCPALFSLAESRHASGREVMMSFLAGYETGSRIGRLVSPSHYARGFHGTSTMGAFAAAAASAKLLGLDEQGARIALGIAGTQASGLQAVFGTMGKPLNAGRCSFTGMHAARLAARGFTAPEDILGAKFGFAVTQSDDFAADAALAHPPRDFHIFAGTFKYHAACYATHGAIEVIRAISAAHPQAVEQAERIVLLAPGIAQQVCSIPAPTTGLGMKFSIATTAAMSLLGHDTVDPDGFNEVAAADPALIAMRERVSIEYIEGRHVEHCGIELHMPGGEIIAGHYDARENPLTLDEQRRRLITKFRSLAIPVLGEARAAELEERLMALETVADFTEIAELATV